MTCVVTIDELKTRLEAIESLHILCTSDARGMYKVWSGRWVVEVKFICLDEPCVLVVSQAVQNPRFFFFVSDLLEFLIELGCDSAQIPLVVGMRGTNYPKRRENTAFDGIRLV